MSHTLRHATCLIACLALAGCAPRTVAPVARILPADVQMVYGPTGVEFHDWECLIDLNDDSIADRLVLMQNQGRGLKLPTWTDLNGYGVTVDGFILFDGRQPNIPVVYQYPDYDGMMIRLDMIGGRRAIVSDGARDHTQYTWGWTRATPDVPLARWEMLWRQWDRRTGDYGHWHRGQMISVTMGK